MVRSAAPASAEQALLEVSELTVRYPLRPHALTALADVSFDLFAGETLGVVGESGCGKSTLARAIIGLTPAAAGSVRMGGTELRGLRLHQRRAFARYMQIIFQDPLAALNPRLPVGEIVAEPLHTFVPGLAKEAARLRVIAMLEQVGLNADMLNRYPHEFSGGQCQRIGIARALVLDPELLICDEAVSALDVSIRAQIVNLLVELQHARGLAMLFIAHDLAVVRHISHRVLVMYLGRVVEFADCDSLYAAPRHPYTQALLAATPTPDGVAVLSAAGEPPSPLDPPAGCAFHPRCPFAVERCKLARPELRVVGGSLVACHRAEEIRVTAETKDR